MKIETPEGPKTTEQVAEMPALEPAGFLEAAAKIAEADDVLSKLSVSDGKIGESSENFAQLVVERLGSPETAPAPRQRPDSLGAAIRVHAGLKRRVEALCARVAVWDMPEDAAVEMCRKLRAAHEAMAGFLAAARETGYKVKSTPKSRMRAHIAAGGKVRLRPEVAKAFKEAYPEYPDIDFEIFDARLTFHGALVKVRGQESGEFSTIVKLSQLLPG